jgi:DNA repair protein RadC
MRPGMSTASDALADPSPTGRPRERLLADGPRPLSDADLLALLLGTGTAKLSARAAALGLLEAVPLAELAWAPADAIAGWPGIGEARAAAIAAAFELGRRGAWSPPRRGERCLDPGRVHELLRHAAHAEREGFHVVLLDVRGRLLRAVQVAEGSLSQCPVSPRDALRPVVREGAHSVVFAHNHPSGVMWRLGLCAHRPARPRWRGIGPVARPHNAPPPEARP